MKKWSILAALLLLSIGIAFAAENRITISTTNPQFKIKKNWELNPWHDSSYAIENPTHAKLSFEIEINPTAKDHFGDLVPSGALKLSCGNQFFYITEYTQAGMVVCTTKDDIRFELIEPKDSPSEGSFLLQIR